MLKRNFLFFSLFVVAAACSKNKLESKPSIELKHMNGNEFLLDTINQFIPDLVMTIEYDDKEGDLGGGTITYVRDRLNIIPIQDAASNDKADTIRSQLPEFPKTSTGEMEIRVPGLFLQEDPDRNDTMEFKIYVQDVAGNVSDTITTPIVVQSKP